MRLSKLASCVLPLKTPFGLASLLALGCSWACPRSSQLPGRNARTHQSAKWAPPTRTLSARPAGGRGAAARSAPRWSCCTGSFLHRPWGFASGPTASTRAGERTGKHVRQTYFLLPHQLRQKDLSMVKVAVRRTKVPSPSTFTSAAPSSRGRPAAVNLTWSYKNFTVLSSSPLWQYGYEMQTRF